MAERRRPATLADVAARAGVSAATVSRVLNGDGTNVRTALSERVRAAADELDYVANAHAQALMRRVGVTVGVIAPQISNPHYNEIIQGILGVAAGSDRLVTMSNTFRDPESELRWVGLFRARRVSALILAGSGWPDSEHTAELHADLVRFRAAGGRVALIGRDDPDVDCVLADNVGGGRAAARALLDLGHTRIAVITGLVDTAMARERLRGFVEGCAEAGQPVAEHRVENGQFTRDGGASAMLAILDRAPDTTAVFCLSDAMAIGALSVLRHRGIDVPGRMSVVGFDDIWLGAELVPALSTIHVPLIAMGETAMRLILEPAGTPPTTRHFATELRERGTTAPCP
jgi:LacI family transcriptional regulator